MQFTIDFATLAGSMDGLAFAMEECENRILEAQEEGSNRTAKAWELTRDKFRKTLNKLANTPSNIQIG
jgi:hypothetical protein